MAHFVSCRSLKSHCFAVRLTVFRKISRSHDKISKVKKSSTQFVSTSNLHKVSKCSVMSDDVNTVQRKYRRQKLTPQQLEPRKRTNKKELSRKRLRDKKVLRISPECQEVFTKESILQRHLLKHSQDVEPSNKCGFCGKVFSREKAFIAHLLNHNREKLKELDYCLELKREIHIENKSEADNDYHISEFVHGESLNDNHSDDTEWSSNHVTEKGRLVANHKTEITEHRANVSAKKKCVTNISGKGKLSVTNHTFKKKHVTKNSKKTQHVTTSKTPRHFCTVCGKGYSQEGSLTNHITVHTGEGAHKCTFCSEVFDRKSQILKHTKKHHPENAPSCSVCHRTFKSASHLQSHMSVHRDFTCDTCGKKFSKKHHLKFHHYCHSGERPLKCEICGKGFKNNYGLRTHQLSHTDNRAHICEQCGKGFKISSHLHRHIQGHTETRNFKCEKCGKTFKQNCHLKVHMYCHTRERRFRCEVCGKGFTQNSYLEKHQCRAELKLPSEHTIIKTLPVEKIHEGDACVGTDVPVHINVEPVITSAVNQSMQPFVMATFPQTQHFPSMTVAFVNSHDNQTLDQLQDMHAHISRSNI